MPETRQKRDRSKKDREGKDSSKKGVIKTELLYGLHPVLAALTTGRRRLDQVYTATGRKTKSQHQDILELAAQRQLPVERVSGAELETLTGSTSHQGVALRAGSYPCSSLHDMLAAKSAEANQLFLVVEGVTDPQNLGALVRTAVCVGVTGIIIPKDNAAPPTPAVSKASAGALEYAVLAREINIARAIDLLKRHSIWVAGLAAEATISIYDSKLTGPLALVVGGEDRGIRRLVRERCDFIVSIPQAHQTANSTINSLNASVAGGVALYEIYRQKNINQKDKGNY